MPTRKPNSNASLGRAIIKSREHKPTARKSKKSGDDGEGDGYVTSKLKDKVVKSIVEENDLDEFLAKADLAGTNFEAEHMNVKFISVDDNKLIDVTMKKDIQEIQEAQNRLRDRLRIPRRPVWNAEMTGDELRASEDRSFLEWRRELAALEQEEHILLTPFERNLEMWRQLWRVIERSDVIVQIVDARNPLLFRCYDLERYVKEIGSDKVNFILINKADLLTPKQRRQWAQYFRQEGINAAFWSAAMLDDSQSTVDKPEDNSEDGKANGDEIDETASDSESLDDSLDPSSESEERDSDQDIVVIHDDKDTPPIDFSNDGKLLNRSQLFDFLKSLRPDKISSGQTLVVGMVGYPNVGKSSTINKLIGEKKVAVSATPGKTKHFQTLFIDDDFCLCDCPGLVMPSFVVSKEQMIVSGILPCDEMRDYTPAIGVICAQVDRPTFERTYGIILPKPSEYDAPDRHPTPHEVLTAYAFVRGFMSSKGIPDSSRAARIIIKDYVNGKLRYCHAPPGLEQKSYNDYEEITNASDVTGNAGRQEMLDALRRRHLLDEKTETAAIDRAFFKDLHGSAHLKTSKKTAVRLDGKHHNNRKKKEKLRRVYGYLDA